MTQPDSKKIKDPSTLDPSFLNKSSASVKIIHLLDPEEFLQTRAYFGILFTESASALLQGPLDTPQAQSQMALPQGLEFVFLNNNYIVSDMDRGIINNFNTTSVSRVTQESFKEKPASDIFYINSDIPVRHSGIESGETTSEFQRAFPTEPSQVLQNTNELITIVPPTESNVGRNQSHSIPSSDHIITIDTAPIVRYLPLNLSLPNTVHLHSGPHASDFAKSQKADAVTVGTEIFFAENRLDLSTTKGLGLLVHELTHVHQNENSSTKYVTSFDSYLEEKALSNERQTLSILGEDNIIQKPIPDSTVNINIGNNMVQDFSTSNFAQTDLSQKFLTTNKLGMFENRSNLFLSNEEFAPNYSVVHDHTFADKNHTNLVYMTPTFVHTEKVVNSTSRASSVSPLPMAAQSDRSSSPSPTAVQPIPPSPPNPSMNIETLTSQIYERITQKIKLERDRVGYR